MIRRPYPGGMRFFVFMRLKVNGDTIETLNAANVRQLLCELGIEPAGVAVEVNLSIVKKSEYERVRLKEGDTVEIVNFVGGG
ncbi:MAG: sulfur carrier protein ThiS [Candidatus Sulfobium sp.]|jgi:sulfur carrier protein